MPYSFQITNLFLASILKNSSPPLCPDLTPTPEVSRGLVPAPRSSGVFFTPFKASLPLLPIPSHIQVVFLSLPILLTFLMSSPYPIPSHIPVVFPLSHSFSHPCCLPLIPFLLTSLLSSTYPIPFHIPVVFHLSHSFSHPCCLPLIPFLLTSLLSSPYPIPSHIPVVFPLSHSFSHPCCLLPSHFSHSTQRVRHCCSCYAHLVVEKKKLYTGCHRGLP